jgi:hypothetical protein
VIAEALRQALASVVGLDTSPAFAEERRAAVEPAWSPIEHESENSDGSPVSSESTG